MKEGNFAFIDSQNVNLAIMSQGWKLDWKKFRHYLHDKYGVTQAYLFMGYILEYESLYIFLRGCGYKIIFKPILVINKEIVKGNVDAELVLHTMIEWKNYKKAIIITNDGDFYCLVKYLFENNKLEILLIPDRKKYSVLLKEFRANTSFLDELQQKLAYKKSP